jgi:hypothetical protein
MHSGLLKHGAAAASAAQIFFFVFLKNCKPVFKTQKKLRGDAVAASIIYGSTHMRCQSALRQLHLRLSLA